MSQALEALLIGEIVNIKGPIGEFTYLGRGRISTGTKTRSVASFIMVCGGTGIAPTLAVLQAVMEDPEDATRCVVLDGNREERDILCRSQLSDLAEANPGRLTIVHALSNMGEEGWRGRRGRVDAALVGAMREGGEIWLVCGPEGNYVWRRI